MRKISCIFIFVVMILAACTPRTDLPPCTANQMVDATSMTPNGGVIVNSIRPIFSWNYEPVVECWPDHFTVIASLKPFPDDRTGRGIDFIETNYGETTLTPSRTGDFEDCRTYFWTVEAPIDPIGAKYSNIAYFRTDFSGDCTWPPGCSDPSELPTPTIVRPYDGERVATLNPILLWDLADWDCEPGSYHVELSTAPDFASNLIDVTYSGSNIHVEDAPYLEDCHRYYWRVTSELGEHLAPSIITQFWTDVTGTCPDPTPCTAAELSADTLIFPVGGEEVFDPRPYLVWKDTLPECVAPHHEFIVSEHLDFSDYVISGGGDIDVLEYPDATVFSTPFEIYHDCTTYYWKTSQTAGDSTIWSEVASFHTNFDGHCFTRPLFDEYIDHIRFDCINPKLTVLLLELTQPVQGAFEARIGDGVWTCAFPPDDSKLLVCTGPWVKENVDVQVLLIDTSNGEEIFSGQVRTSICEIPTPAPCQPPAGGCKAPCNWDQATCACRTPNGVCQ